MCISCMQMVICVNTCSASKAHAYVCAPESIGSLSGTSLWNRVKQSERDPIYLPRLTGLNLTEGKEIKGEEGVRKIKFSSFIQMSEG